MNGICMTREELVKNYNVEMNFLEYWSLIKSIPQEWKQCLREDSGIEEKYSCVNL